MARALDVIGAPAGARWAWRLLPVEEVIGYGAAAGRWLPRVRSWAWPTRRRALAGRTPGPAHGPDRRPHRHPPADDPRCDASHDCARRRDQQHKPEDVGDEPRGDQQR